MEIKSNQQIYDEIMLFLHNNGGEFNEWYAGVTASPEESLLSKHKVDKTKDLWIYRKAKNPKDAAILKEVLVTSHKLNGIPGSTDKNSVYVYAYKKTNRAKQ